MSIPETYLDADVSPAPGVTHLIPVMRLTAVSFVSSNATEEEWRNQRRHDEREPDTD